MMRRLLPLLGLLPACIFGSSSTIKPTDPFADLDGGGKVDASDAAINDGHVATDAMSDGSDAVSAPIDGGAACTCSTGVSCLYGGSPPVPNLGVTLVVLTPTAATRTVMADVIGEQPQAHDAAWFDLDLRAFSSGSLQILGTVGSGDAAVSSYLVDECSRFPSSGTGFSTLQNQSDKQPGASWSMSYVFGAGEILHFGTEGNWYSPASSTNTNTVTFTVQ